MPLSDLFSPLKRQFWLFATVLLVISLGSYVGLMALPETQKTTIYFSLKPLETQQEAPTFDHAESTMKMAEAMAGWAKNPQFREDIAAEAGVSINNFKRKLAARKQNYINVFWTLKLQNEEIQHRDKVVAALLSQIENRFTVLNENSRAPYAMTTAEVFSESQAIPTWALVLFSLILGLGLGILSAYIKELVTDKLSFNSQLKNLFPESPMLTLSQKLGQQDEKLIEQFLLTFESPQLIGTFTACQKHFTLPQRETINPQKDTPILIVRLGDSQINELQNMKAIFGEQVGLIVFNQ